jgi:hypothetical protein
VTTGLLRRKTTKEERFIIVICSVYGRGVKGVAFVLQGFTTVTENLMNCDMDFQGF